jgi:hypothetical protein
MTTSTYDVTVEPGTTTSVIVETSGESDTEWAGVTPGVVVIEQSPQIAQVIEIPVPGFPGPAGSGTAAPMDERVEMLNDYTILRGEAAPGSSEADAVWRIRCVTIAYADVVETRIGWADGSRAFNKSWAGRAAYTYE